MSEKCKFCGAKKEVTKCGVEFYDCDTYYGITSGEWSRGHECQSHQIAALEAEVKRWRTLCEQSHLLLTALVKHKAIVRDPKLDLWGCVNEHGIDLLTALTEAK